MNIGEARKRSFDENVEEILNEVLYIENVCSSPKVLFKFHLEKSQ